jgi:GT2 family glycosyltransferase
MNLSILILNWNAAEDTIRCVNFIQAWQRIKPAIWVVDNYSSDNSADLISKICPDIHLIRNSTNQGFAGGNNRGLEAILSQSDAPILLLNNDAFIDEDSVIQLLETLQTNKTIGFIGPLLFADDNHSQLLSAGGRDPTKHHHSHIPQIPPGNSIMYPVEYVPGTVIMGRAEVFQKTGLLDKDFFFTMEIADLCMRAARQGYLNIIDTRAAAVHALDRSSNYRGTLHPYYIIRNRFLFIRKHHPYQIQLYGFWSIYSLALALKTALSGRPNTARAIFLGLIDGWRGQFGNRNQLFVSSNIDS